MSKPGPPKTVNTPNKRYFEYDRIRSKWDVSAFDPNLTEGRISYQEVA